MGFVPASVSCAPDGSPSRRARGARSGVRVHWVPSARRGCTAPVDADQASGRRGALHGSGRADLCDAAQWWVRRAVDGRRDRRWQRLGRLRADVWRERPAGGGRVPGRHLHGAGPDSGARGGSRWRRVRVRVGQRQPGRERQWGGSARFDDAGGKVGVLARAPPARRPEPVARQTLPDPTAPRDDPADGDTQLRTSWHPRTPTRLPPRPPPATPEPCNRASVRREDSSARVGPGPERRGEPPPATEARPTPSPSVARTAVPFGAMLHVCRPTSSRGSSRRSSARA